MAAEDVPLASLRRRLGRVGSTNATILAEIEIIVQVPLAVSLVRQTSSLLYQKKLIDMSQSGY